MQENILALLCYNIVCKLPCIFKVLVISYSLHHDPLDFARGCSLVFVVLLLF